MKSLNNKGSAMVWAIVTIMIISIVITGVIVIGSAYSQRTISNVASMQAYLTARSAADIVKAQIDGYTQTFDEGDTINYDNDFIPDTVNGTVAIDNFNFDSSMGTAVVTVTRTATDSLTIHSVGTVGDSSEEVDIICSLSIEYIENENSPQVTGFDGLNVTTLAISKTTNLTLGDGTDLYIVDLETPGNNKKSLIIGGNLYTNLNTNYDENTHTGKIKGVRFTADDVLPYNAITISDGMNIDGNFYSLNDNFVNTIDLLTLKGDSSDFYYYLTDDDYVVSELDGQPDSNGVISTNTTLEVSGTNNYYIRVAAGCTLNLNVVNNSENPDDIPSVYIMLDAGAESLNIYSCSDVYLYLYGGNDSSVWVKDGLTINGGISVERLECNGNLTFNAVEPHDATGITPVNDGAGGPGGPGGPGSGGAPYPPEEPTEPEPSREVHTWSFTKYE